MSSNRGILDILPLDVLELLLSEAYLQDSKVCSFDAMARPVSHRFLREVCKVFNEIVGPRACRSMNIGFSPSKRKRGIARNQLSILALDVNGAHSRWTKKLKIHYLFPSININRPSYYRDQQDKDFISQAEYLLPAIKSLVQVEEVEFHANSGSPYYDVLCALAGLPCLKTLNFVFEGKAADIPLSKFSGLSIIKLRDIHLPGPMQKTVNRMLAKSPSITELHIDLESQTLSRLWQQRTAEFDFDRLIKDAMNSPTFNPSLKTLAVTERIAFKPLCLPFLRSLTHLQASDDSIRAYPLFWDDLLGCGVRLQVLNGFSVTRSLTRYLLSYEGVEELFFTPPHEVQDEDMVHDFFYSVPRHHRKCLETLVFNHTKPSLWCITQEKVEQLLVCKALKYLHLMVYNPPFGEDIFPIVALDTVLTAISDNLPQLQELTLTPAGKFSVGIFGAIGLQQAFSERIRETVFPSKNFPSFNLFLDDHIVFNPTRDSQGVCSFAMVSGFWEDVPPIFDNQILSPFLS